MENIIKGWLIVMLKSIFVSLVCATGFSGKRFGEVYLVSSPTKTVTIQEALISGGLVQDDWMEFGLRLIQTCIYNDWLKEDSAETDRLLDFLRYYSSFSESKSKLDYEFYQRAFLECVVHWLSDAKSHVYISNSYTRRERDINKGEWLIWVILSRIGKKRMYKKVYNLIEDSVLLEREIPTLAKTGWVFFDYPTKDDVEDFLNPEAYFDANNFVVK